MSDHTPEPWKLMPQAKMNVLALREGSHSVVSNCGGYAGSTKSHDENHANAQRIVQCVNAMAGIEEPEKFIKKMAEVIKTGLVVGDKYCFSACGNYNNDEVFDLEHLCKEALALFPTKEPQ